MFTLLSADQQRELAQFVLERTTGCINFTDVPYQTIFRGKYSIPQKMNHPLTETRSGDLYFKALAVRIAELTEDLEELRFEKALLLQKFEYAEDAGAEAFRKDIATMEAGLKKLETREQKYSVELDNVLTEYAELKAQAVELDPVELYETRQAIRPVQEKESEKQLEDAMHEKPFLIMLLGAKQETSRLLGEDAEERQVRQLIAHKRQEQHRNSISKRKRSDPER